MLSEKNVGSACARIPRGGFKVPLMFVLRLCLPVLLMALFAASLRAQESQQAQPQTPQPQTPQQERQQRRLEIRQMQTRRAQSRQRRIQQVVKDTYSHRFEIYTGGMYLRFSPGPYLHNAGTGGWELGLAGFLTPRWGITGDVRGYYGSTAITINNPYDIHNASFSVFTFTAGPQYRFYRSQHFAVSAALQGGIVYGYFDADTNGFQPQLVGMYPPDVVPGGIASIHIDYNLSPGLAVRFSPQMLIESFSSSVQHNQGFLMGVVYRFGRQ